MLQRKRAIVIGAGYGGLAMGIRLQSLGYDTTLVEALDRVGGRGRVLEQDGFVFDMGPTVITVPHFIEELFALERDAPALEPSGDFPAHTLLPDARITTTPSGGPATSRYCELVPLSPFYRIWFADGTYFDYDGDPVHTREQIRAIAPSDLDGYERFERDARAIFERGFLELGYTRFADLSSMLAVAPDLLRLDAVRNLFRFVSNYFASDKLRRVFSFETLLVGGNPLTVPAIYAMIHFVEKTWGIHFVRGGTGQLAAAFARKFEDLGGQIRVNSPVAKIHVDAASTSLTGPRGHVRGVVLEDGTELPADLVVSNADWAHTYGKLIDARFTRWNGALRRKAARYSMSVVVVYFGFRKREGETLDLQHHNIILGRRYEALLHDIFRDRVLPQDYSQYLHLPTLTDPSLAPEGCHAAYTLIPVPHNGSGIDWAREGEAFVERVIGVLDDDGYIPGLRERIVTSAHITPDHFEHTMRSHLGNAFGLEPILPQTAYFRPHNASEDVNGLYLVGASTQPGAGTPSVMMSAKMTARAILEREGMGN